MSGISLKHLKMQYISEYTSGLPHSNIFRAIYALLACQIFDLAFPRNASPVNALFCSAVNHIPALPRGGGKRGLDQNPPLGSATT